MEPNELTNLIDSFFGGSDERYRHWAFRRLIYTEGVKAVATEAGAYWLLDIVATEIAPIMARNWDAGTGFNIGFLQVKSKDGKADLIFGDDVPENLVHWSRHIHLTDFPDGDWVFYLEMDGTDETQKPVVAMLLPSEH